MVYHGSPAKYLQSLAETIVERLSINHRCLFLDSPPMVAGIRSYLAAAGLDVTRAAESGALVLSSDQSHLTDGKFDVDRMLEMLEGAVEQAEADGYAGLWATGDMSWELGSERTLGKLIAYECGLEDLFRRRPSLTGVCRYHADLLPAHAVRAAFTTHRSLYLNQTLARLNPFYQAEAPAPAASHGCLEDMLGWLHQQAES